MGNGNLAHDGCNITGESISKTFPFIHRQNEEMKEVGHLKGFFHLHTCSSQIHPALTIKVLAQTTLRGKAVNDCYSHRDKCADHSLAIPAASWVRR